MLNVFFKISFLSIFFKNDLNLPTLNLNDKKKIKFEKLYLKHIIQKFNKLKFIDIILKFKRNYKYFFFFKDNNKNSFYTACTTRITSEDKKKLKVKKKQIKFLDFLQNIFNIYLDLVLTKHIILFLSNFLIFFYKNFITFFKKYLFNFNEFYCIVFNFYCMKYKNKKIKTCKKNMQKKIFLNFRKKNNLLN